MKAIILAAGAGKRLGQSGPKSMIDVGGMSIIHRQIANFRAAGMNDFVVVVGFAHEQLQAHLTSLPVRFTFVKNDRFAETNTIYSLYLARSYMPGGFYYANADVVFDRRLAERLRGAPTEHALAVQTGRCAEEEVKVIVQDGRITKIGKQLNPSDCLGEFIGVARFGSAISDDFSATLERLVERESIVKDYFERAVDQLCSRHVLTPVDVSDLPCVEIDFSEDLARARSQIAPQLAL